MTVYERREEILDYLAVKRKTTAPELAKRFHVSVQTIWRDFQWLSHDYPLEIIPNRGGGIKVMDGCYIYRGKFTPEEDELLRRQYLLLQGKDRQILEGILKKHSYSFRKEK